ncbi:MAG: alpha-2-macroglobulin family protein, partial [Verrucomicrobiota bacterium]
AAEVSLGVADDSVYAIQPELAGDPRPFFFGEKRASQGSFSSTVNERPYRRLVRSPRDGFHDDRSGPPGAPESAAAEGGMAAGLALGDAPVLAARFGLRAKGGRSAQPLALADAAPALGEALARGAPPGAALADAGPAGAGVPEPAVVVRSDFRATAFWKPDVVTGPDGTAVVRLAYPESLTRWRATARAVSRETQVGWASAPARTRLPLRVRLQSPRFLVAGDVAVVSSVMMNQTEQPVTVESRLVAEGVEVLGGWVDGAPAKVKKAPTVTIPARGEVREDWAVRAARPGPVRLQVSAQGGGLSDAMERSIETFEHGLEQVVAATVQARSGDATLPLVLPGGRRPGSTRLAVQVTPSLALTLLDALPYLAEDSEGSTEQTLSRFVPAVTVRKTLR